MSLPYVDVSSPILRAYFDGLAVRQREIENQQRNQVQQEQLKLQNEQQERLRKQGEEQLKLQREAQQLAMQRQQKELDLRALDLKSKNFANLVNLRGVPPPDNQQERLGAELYEMQGMLQPGEFPQAQYTKPLNFLGSEFSPEELQTASGMIGNIESQERRVRAQQEAMLLRQGQNLTNRSDIAEERNATQLAIANMRGDIATEIARMRTNQAGSNTEQVSSTVNALMPRIIDGTINEETIGKMVGSKSREAVIREVTSRGEFLQSKKWQEESRKLAGSKGYLQLIERFTQSDPFKSAEHFGKFWALSGLTRQQIGQYGAQFPALGRLSDADIRLLESGIPTKINIVLEKFGLPKTKAAATSLVRTIMDESKRAYALSVKTHFATVPNDPEIRYRLTEQYGLNIPGLGNYFKELK